MSTLSHDGVHPVVPPDKMYEGLVDGGDWYLVYTEHEMSH